ncbi:hypothetical protein SteCoe_32066 [Stentor coeruleus]|uniref:ACB domain-containing protein n=1 Tax=Stentor coeruleus TaxID=5963 RepID=A0A1R2AZY5_9CILI|nr:hypothetical protein SteCoe_32066 [Stentor coeruleus]
MNKNFSCFHNWSLEKQYAAAEYYLKSCNPQIINESQKSQLNALHMQISYGPYKEGLLLPEIQNCSQNEKAKRFNAWKNLKKQSRISSMKNFLELMHSLLPNWHKSDKISIYFELSCEPKTIEPQYFQSTPTAKNIILNKTERSIEDISKHKPLHRRLANSVSNPLYTPTNYKAFVKNAELITKMKNVRESFKKLTQKKIHNAIYTKNNFEIPENEVYEDHVPIVMRDLFDNLENQCKSKKTQMPMFYKNTLSYSQQTPKKPEYLEEITVRVKDMLLALEDEANEVYEAENNALTEAIKCYNTDIVENILRPKLNMLSTIIKEVEDVFYKEFNEKAKDVCQIHKEFSEAIDMVFTYMQLLDKNRMEILQQKIIADNNVKMLEKGFLAVKELYDPKNTQFQLYGHLKLTKDKYKKNLIECKDFLPQEDVDIMNDLQDIIRKLEDNMHKLNVEVKLKNVEIGKYQKLIKEIQQKSYKDNIDLSNQCNKLKESLGILRGSADISLGETYRTENDVLKKENDELKVENDSLVNEILMLKTPRNSEVYFNGF